MDAQTIKTAIRAKALETGFDAVAFGPAETSAGERDGLAAYLAQGRHGSMTWMEETRERREAPRAMWAGARTAIVLGTNYGPGEDPLAILERPDRGAISVYARGRDYHDLVKKRLKKLGRWIAEQFGAELKVFVDTAPVMEKPLAQRAGLGWQGRHTTIVSRRFGSWLFLGEILTALELPADPPATDLCGSCRRCLDACPTGALTDSRQMDARRCISYLTIEHAGPIEDSLARAMGNRIFGCDDCLAVCPWNKFALPTLEPALQPFVHTQAPRLSDLAALNDAEFRQVFSGSPIKRSGRERMLRNVMIALGNSADPSLAPLAEAATDDDSSTVRETAAWALARLAEKQGNS